MKMSLCHFNDICIFVFVFPYSFLWVLEFKQNNTILYVRT